MCEFIEDCEHTALSTRVLHLLGCEGPTTQNPSRYIRFIYNRVILEATQVSFGIHMQRSHQLNPPMMMQLAAETRYIAK